MSIEHEDSTDFNQNELLNARLQQLGSDPSTAVEGQIWYRSDTHRPSVETDTGDEPLAYLSDVGTVATPLYLTTDGVGTDLAMSVKATTSSTSHMEINVATATPIMSFTQTGSQITIEPTTIHAHAGYDIVNVTAPLIQISDSSPSTPSTVEITAHDITRNGVSAFDLGASNPERSTGLLTWTGVKLVKVDATHIGVGALTGIIVDTTGAITDISYAGTASVLDAYVGTTSNTYFTINSSGALIQRSTHPTPQQSREEIFLGFSVHAPVGTITTVTADPDISINTMSQVRDLLNDGMGIVNKGIRPLPNGANLQLNMLGGYLYSLGINFVNNALDPSRIAFTALTPATFQYRTQTGNATGNLTSMEVGYYDVAGTRTAIGSSKYSTQRVYVSPSGLVRLQYGQVTYNSMSAALAALPSESFIPYPAFQQNLVLAGSITVSSNATLLNDLSHAIFTPASIFGELVVGGGGTSTTTLQGAYNNSGEPEILLDATRGAVSIKAITNANNSLEILDSAGATTASIAGDGLINSTGLDITSPTNSASGISFKPGADNTNQLKQAVRYYQPGISTQKAIVGYREGVVSLGAEDFRVAVTDAGVTPSSSKVRIGTGVATASDWSDGQLAIGHAASGVVGVWRGGLSPASRTTANYLLYVSSASTYLNAPTNCVLAVGDVAKLTSTATSLTASVDVSVPSLTYNYTNISGTTYTALTVNTTLNMAAGTVYRRYLASYRLTLGITGMTVQGSTAFLSVTQTTSASYTNYIDYPGSNGDTVTITLLNTAIVDPIDFMFIRSGSGFMCLGRGN